MSTTVVGPDNQEFEFPDGTSPEVMKAAMRKHYGAPKAPAVPVPAVAAAPVPVGKPSILDGLKQNAADFMAPIHAAAQGVQHEIYDEAGRRFGNLGRLIKNPGYDTADQVLQDVVSGPATGVKVGLATAGAIGSPLMGAVNTVVAPVTRAAGGALYDAGRVVPKVDVSTPQGKLLPKVRIRTDLTRPEAQQSLNDAVGTIGGTLAGMVGGGEFVSPGMAARAESLANGAKLGKLSSMVRTADASADANPASHIEANAPAARSGRVAPVVPDVTIPPSPHAFLNDKGEMGQAELAQYRQAVAEHEGTPLPLTPTTPPEMQAFRRYDGVDHPVEITGAPQYDMQTKQVMRPVRGATGAEGYVPEADIVHKPAEPVAGPVDEYAPKIDMTGATSTGISGPAAQPRPVVGARLKMSRADRQAQQARQLVLRDIEAAVRGGVDVTAPEPEVSLTAAERLGQGARNRLGAAANLSEPVATALHKQLALRIGETGGLAHGGFENKLGISPEEAARGVDETLADMRSAAKPLYDEYVRGNKAPQMSPIIAEERATNSIYQSAERKAMRDMRGMKHPTAIETDEIHIPEGRPTGAGRSSTQYMGDVNELMRGGIKKANRGDGLNLNEFIAARGGLQDLGGDLVAMNANDNTYNRGMGKLGKLVRNNGSTLHDAAVAAWEGGYFREVPTERELLDAIDEGLRGRAVRSMHDAQTGRARSEYLSQLEDRIRTLPIPNKATPRQIAEALANDDASTDALSHLGETDGIYPGTIGETQTMEHPTLELLDLTKQNLDDMYDIAVERGEKAHARAIDETRKRLIAEADRLNPGGGGVPSYAEIRKVGGEAPRVEKIYDETPRFVKGSIKSNAQFDKWVADKTPQEARAALARIADDITKTTGKRPAGTLPGNISLAEYTTKDFQYRFTKLGRIAGGQKGAKQANDLVEYLRTLDESRASAVDLLPRGNSKTSRLQAAQAALNGDLGEVDLTKMPRSKSDLVGTALNHLIGGPVNQAINNVRLGGPTNVFGAISKEGVLAEYADLQTKTLPELLKELRTASPKDAKRLDRILAEIKTRKVKP